MARDPARIDVVLAALRVAWLREPDLRLGQLVTNLTPSNQSTFGVEDDRLHDAAVAYALPRDLSAPSLVEELRSALAGAIEQIAEHHREYQHVTPKVQLDAWNGLLARAAPSWWRR